LAAATAELVIDIAHQTNPRRNTAFFDMLDSVRHSLTAPLPNNQISSSSVSSSSSSSSSAPSHTDSAARTAPANGIGGARDAADFDADAAIGHLKRVLAATKSLESVRHQSNAPFAASGRTASGVIGAENTAWLTEPALLEVPSHVRMPTVQPAPRQQQQQYQQLSVVDKKTSVQFAPATRAAPPSQHTLHQSVLAPPTTAEPSMLSLMPHPVVWARPSVHRMPTDVPRASSLLTRPPVSSAAAAAAITTASARSNWPSSVRVAPALKPSHATASPAQTAESGSTPVARGSSAVAALLSAPASLRELCADLPSFVALRVRSEDADMLPRR
jgi:hypothetical protein